MGLFYCIDEVFYGIDMGWDGIVVVCIDIWLIGFGDDDFFVFGNLLGLLIYFVYVDVSVFDWVVFLEWIIID